MSSLRKKLSPEATAQALLVNSNLYGDEKDRQISRFRFTKHNLQMVSGYMLLTPEFLQQLSSSLWEMGWSMIHMPDGDFAFIETSKMSMWPRLGWGRLEAALRSKAPETAIEVEFNKCFPEFESELSFG